MADMISNRYIIVKLIGEGGMADVYLAIDSILKREVAVKVLRGELADDPVNLQRFQKEAMAISNTSHPNIVEIYDVGEDNGKNYIVMEYVRGRTLKQLIKQRGSLPIDESVNIMKQLVSAVSHAHKVGIIHRDIKSQNVLVKDDGTVKLSDFGIAYTADSSGLTQAETVVGSVHYLAPELANGKTASAQSDIYSLGIVFYELLTSDVPYHGDSAVDIALKHLRNDVPSVREYNPQIPQSVENIVIKSTCRDKSLRYATAMDMYNDLVTCLDASRFDEEKIDMALLMAKKEGQQQVDSKKTNKTSKNSKSTAAKKKKKKSGGDSLGFLMVLAAVALCIVFFFMIKGITSDFNYNANDVRIPDIYLYDIEDARSVLESMNIRVESVTYQSTDNHEKGQVINISPAVNTVVKENSSVTLVVSLGKRYTISDYTGMNIDQVKALLEKNGFTVNVSLLEDKSNEAGTIIFQDIPADTVVEPTDPHTINFNVSTYVSFMIPELKNKSIAVAKEMLESMGAKVKLEQMNIETNLDSEGKYIFEPGTVVSCLPECNTYYTQTPGVVITIYYY